MIRLPADQIDALKQGAQVVFAHSHGTFGRTQVQTGEVVRLTPTQIVVRYAEAGRTIELRFRKKDGLIFGERYGYLLDPREPDTAQRLSSQLRNRRRWQIDALAQRWTKDRNDLEALRELHNAIGKYLDAES